jgi:hypothetical protein
VENLTAVATVEEGRYAIFGRAMIVNVRGRVEGCKTRAGTPYTRVLVPSVDPYAHPQLVEIRSRSRLGVKDDEISCSCILRGFQKKSRKKHKGKGVKIVQVEHTLDLCEAAD